jgi:hypothetical protein
MVTLIVACRWSWNNKSVTNLVISSVKKFFRDIFNTKIQIIYYESYGPVAVAGVLAFYGSCKNKKFLWKCQKI